MDKTFFASFIIISLIVFNEQTLKAQKKCEVLIPDLSGSYDGDCKKGLAHGKGEAKGIDSYIGVFKKGLPHGKGKYQWKNGVIYDGNWSKGMRSGFGVWTFSTTKGDSIAEGYWRENRYLGKTNIPSYSIIGKNNLERYSFKKVSYSESNRLRINIRNAGGSRSSVSELYINFSSGNKQEIGDYILIEDISFPYTGSIRYNIPSKLNSHLIPVSFEFTINDPGAWDVTLTN